MAITFVELDEGVVDRLKNTAVFHDIQLPWDQETLHSKLEELGASMQSSLLCQKILLHKNSFDDILSMSTTAMSLFDLTTPPRLCGLLYGAISVSSTASTPDIFSSVLDKIRQCNLGCAKLSAHYKEIPMPGRMSLQEAQTRFAATYEVIIEFLGLLISKFDYRPIRECPNIRPT
jgi:hypothetical protein